MSWRGRVVMDRRRAAHVLRVTAGDLADAMEGVRSVDVRKLLLRHLGAVTAAMLPLTREDALARTKVEEAVFWLSRAAGEDYQTTHLGMPAVGTAREEASDG